MPTKTTARKLDDLGLTAEEKAALREELEAELRAAGSTVPRGAEPRELTPRELAVRALLRERDHADGCPLIDSEERSAGRVEAYRAIRPARPDRGEPAKVLTTVRCIECGGDRTVDGEPAAVLLAALGTTPVDGAELDATLG
jgi:hypothetical protein